MIDVSEIRSLDDFQRHAPDYIHRMRETRAPVVLTVDGKAELVVQDAEAYQALLERLEHAETVAAVRAAMEEFDPGEGRPAREPLEQLRKKHGIPD